MQRLTRHVSVIRIAFSALTLLVGRQEGHPACKETEWRGAGVVICLELGADLHVVQLMPLPLTVSCFSKIEIGFTFLVPAHPGSPGQRAVKWVCVCVCVRVCVRACLCVSVIRMTNRRRKVASHSSCSVLTLTNTAISTRVSTVSK